MKKIQWKSRTRERNSPRRQHNWTPCLTRVTRVRENVDVVLQWLNIKNNNNNKLMAWGKEEWGDEWNCIDEKYGWGRSFWAGRYLMNRLKFRKENPMAGETHQEQGFPLALLPSKRVLRHCGISTWAAGTAEISHHLHIWNSWWREKVRMSSLGSSLSPARLLADPTVPSDLSPAASSSRSIYFLFCQGSYR